jgi:uncharacterized protein
MNDLIMKTVAGSHLYGTAIETSDVDYRGICFEPINAVLGLQPFEQYINPVGDETIYGLRKFIKLALDNNPNIVELLFAPKPIYYNGYWTLIEEHRDYFLSRRVAKTFVGYAVSQAKRIEGHHKWLTEEPPQKPDPADYGRVMEGEKESWTYYGMKQKYENDLRKFQQYETWKKNRNPARSELEEKWGHDTKHGMHLVRLLQQGEELLKTGFLTLPRPNAKKLLEIRNGLLTYDELIDYMQYMIEKLDEFADNSILPEKPDYNTINELVIRLNYTHVMRRYL